MTTIAACCKSGVMAADTLAVAGDTIHGKAETKIWRINGCLVGAAGCKSDTLKFGLWFEGHDLANIPKLDKDFVAMVLSRKGIFLYFDDAIPTYSPDMKMYAIGSGWIWAKAALDFGKSPQDAIRYAMTKDIITGGKVRAMAL